MADSTRRVEELLGYLPAGSISRAPPRLNELFVYLKDPATHNYLTKAVVLIPSGHTVDEDYAIKLMAGHHQGQCPISKKKITDYVPNYALQSLIEADKSGEIFPTKDETRAENLNDQLENAKAMMEELRLQIIEQKAQIDAERKNAYFWRSQACKFENECALGMRQARSEYKTLVSEANAQVQLAKQEAAYYKTQLENVQGITSAVGALTLREDNVAASRTIIAGLSRANQITWSSHHNEKEYFLSGAIGTCTIKAGPGVKWWDVDISMDRDAPSYVRLETKPGYHRRELAGKVRQDQDDERQRRYRPT